MSTPIGIILPPADIRTKFSNLKEIVDKTAEFVAKNGQSFEELVIKAETNNQKFSFLKKDDPYRPYYESQVQTFQKQQQAQTSASEPQPSTIQKNPLRNPESIVKYEGPHIQPISFFSEFSSSSRGNRELRPPQPDVFSVPTPKNLLPLEVDIMKHTAQFVALHGQKFLMEITEREKNNPQFDFVKPNNIYFTYFTKLIDAYSRCIQPKKDDIIKLQQFSYDRNNILQKCFDRFEYENNQEQNKMIQERLAQEERYQIEQIDWNDFIIVETIDLFDNEDLPAPEKQIEQETIPSIGAAPRPQQTSNQEQFFPPPPMGDDNFIPQSQIITEAKQPSIDQSGKETIKCHVCNQQIPINEFTQHLKIELMDPKYRDQKSLSEQSQPKQTNAQQFESSLKQFAQKRNDIFGDANNQLNTISANQQKLDPEQYNENLDDENSQFIPESIWLKTHPGQISIFIKVPDEGGEEQWKLNGQILQLQFDPKTTIGQIKSELFSILSMPSTKQKLRIKNLILKDNFTLAYYNIMNSCSIELNIKERGGRQK